MAKKIVSGGANAVGQAVGVSRQSSQQPSVRGGQRSGAEAGLGAGRAGRAGHAGSEEEEEEDDEDEEITQQDVKVRLARAGAALIQGRRGGVRPGVSGKRAQACGYCVAMRWCIHIGRGSWRRCALAPWEK